MLTTCGCNIIQPTILPLTQQRLLAGNVCDSFSVIHFFSTWSNRSGSVSTDVDSHARLPSLPKKQKVKGHEKEEGEQKENRGIKGTTELHLCVCESLARGFQSPRGPQTATPPTEERGFVGSGQPLLLLLLAEQLLSSFLCGTGLDLQVHPMT